MGISITHNKESLQFIANIENKSATLSYKFGSDANTLDYYSTFVPQELRGRHVGEEIVIYALDYAKENQLKIIPTCPFVKRIIDQHPEYQSLVA